MQPQLHMSIAVVQVIPRTISGALQNLDYMFHVTMHHIMFFHKEKRDQNLDGKAFYEVQRESLEIVHFYEFVEIYTQHFKGYNQVISEYKLVQLSYDIAIKYSKNNFYWIWVCSENCEACRPQSRYSEGLSKTYRKVSDDPILITYGTGQVIGEQGTEKICLMKNSFCAENVSFLTVTDMSPDLSGLRADGILGMSPSKQATQADLLINELYSQGSIDEKVFSLYIQPEEKNSKITIGGYDLESFVKPDQNGVKKIYWHDLSNTNYWTLGLKKAFYGDHQLQPTVSNVIVDSGTSYMLIPTEDFKQFTDIMSDQYICGRQRAYNNLYACLCTDSEYETYPDFRIQIDDIQYSKAP